MGYFAAHKTRNDTYSVRLLEFAQQCLEAGYTPLISYDTKGYISYMTVYRQGENEKIEVLDFQVSSLPYRFTFHAPICPSRKEGSCITLAEVDIDTPLTLENIDQYFTIHYKSVEVIPAYYARKHPTIDQLVERKRAMKPYQDGFVVEYAKGRGVSMPAPINPFESEGVRVWNLRK